MANRTRFRATGLAAIIGKLTIKHSTQSQNHSSKSMTTVNTQTALSSHNRSYKSTRATNTQTALQGKSNAGSRRVRKA